MTREAEGKMTEGPWEAVFEDDPRGQPVGYYRGLICLISTGDDRISVVASDGRTSNSDEWKANAKAIAALPELIEALRGFVFIAHGSITKEQADWQVSCAVGNARAALAKAPHLSPMATISRQARTPAKSPGQTLNPPSR